ncbi:hypothetical protein NHX12_020554 [Muraenolepis orangiensis]|uniref:Uncharacterized protein n=1 Tax=Muraenolepis orangiensis TaxID=630683 RepID=A0A9Q0ETQ0_9TELE|nr:hypothetical protein NHX12_020554 [Muraenolepis orangiensis]
MGASRPTDEQHCYAASRKRVWGKVANCYIALENSCFPPIHASQAAIPESSGLRDDKRSPCCKSLVPQTPTTLCRSVGHARKTE